MIPSSAHLIGIGGTGMSALAHCLLDAGCTVTGSDSSPGEAVAALEQRGARVARGHAANHVPDGVELVVRSAAVPEDNIEVRDGTIKYADMIGRLTRQRRTLAVAGAHGKTTTTAMLTTILHRAGLNPSFLCGGFIPQLGRPGAWNESRDLVVEACEYDRSFLKFKTDCAVVTNIDADHLDYYRDLDEIRGAFEQFAGSARHVVAPPDTVAAGDTFGFESQSDWRAERLTPVDGCWSFEVTRYGRPFGPFRLQVPGRHNVLNALAAIAAADWAGVGMEIIQVAMAEFIGAARRFQILGERRGVVVVDDYAHHPAEIRAVLRAARERFPGRKLWCVFQPHQHSRTRRFINDFARSFGDADRVLVTKVFSARDPKEPGDASRDLSDRINKEGRPALYVGAKDEALDFALQQVPDGSLMLTIGAGDIGAVARGYMMS